VKSAIAFFGVIFLIGKMILQITTSLYFEIIYPYKTAFTLVFQGEDTISAHEMRYLKAYGKIAMHNP
jgi:hypothetical protein